jgi:hypothetical protein
MNYRYNIIRTSKTKSGPYQQIQEIDSNGFFLTHSIGEINNLAKDYEGFTPVLWESFLRTKKWVMENHPELLL